MCVSSWCTVIARLSAGTGPTYSPIGSSTSSAPIISSLSTAAAVNCLVIDMTSYAVSQVADTCRARSASPNPAQWTSSPSRAATNVPLAPRGSAPSRIFAMGRSTVSTALDRLDR